MSAAKAGLRAHSVCQLMSTSFADRCQDGFTTPAAFSFSKAQCRLCRPGREGVNCTQCAVGRCALSLGPLSEQRRRSGSCLATSLVSSQAQTLFVIVLTDRDLLLRPLRFSLGGIPGANLTCSRCTRHDYSWTRCQHLPYLRVWVLLGQWVTARLHAVPCNNHNCASRDTRHSLPGCVHR